MNLTPLHEERKMILELTSDEIGWLKYALIRASDEAAEYEKAQATLNGRDKDMTLKEERLLLRIVRKIERQEKQRGKG